MYEHKMLDRSMDQMCTRNIQPMNPATSLALWAKKWGKVGGPNIKYRKFKLENFHHERETRMPKYEILKIERQIYKLFIVSRTVNFMKVFENEEKCKEKKSKDQIWICEILNNMVYKWNLRYNIRYEFREPKDQILLAQR